jgi:bloom syndrome protein
LLTTFGKVVVEKGLRAQPFPDHILRDMAISFPKGEI